jgi:hypothetical protein
MCKLYFESPRTTLYLMFCWPCNIVYQYSETLYLFVSVLSCALHNRYCICRTGTAPLDKSTSITGWPSVYGISLWSPYCWDCGFEILRGHECLSCECRVLSGRGLCDGLNTRSEEIYRVCVCVCLNVCNLETPRTGRSRPKLHDWTWKVHIVSHIIHVRCQK